MEPLQCHLLAVLVEKPPASPSSSISPPVVAVMPADNNNNNNNKTLTPPSPVTAVPIRLVVCVWALLNAVGFAAVNIAALILNRIPCTKSTWLFRCVALTTKAAAAELSFLSYGVLLCSAAAALAAPLHMLLTTRRTSRLGTAAAVDALAWVALAATAGMHCTEVVSDRICLAAVPGDTTYIFVDVVCGSVLLAVDLFAGVMLCRNPRRRRLEELGEQQGDHDGDALGDLQCKR